MRTRKDWQRTRNAVPLRLPLPNIRIPLRPSDDDDDCYRDGRYQRITAAAGCSRLTARRFEHVQPGKLGRVEPAASAIPLRLPERPEA
jgi:hypothetical protein